MATSGYRNVTVTSWDTLKFSWWVNSQNVANNTTTIGWKLELVATSNGYIQSSASKKWTATVNGTPYSGTNTVGISNNSTKTLASGTTTIAHDADGSKTFSYSFSQQFDINFNGWIGTISGSSTGTLNTIPRASQPSCITWPNHTQNVGSFGDTISIHMNRNSDKFTHTVRYAFGSQTGTIATGVTTGTTWKIPESLMNLIPETTSGSGTIYADTYNGSTLVGTKYCGFTATVPATVKPTCSLTLEDVTGIDKTYGSPVQNLSKIKITVKPSLAYSSPIASYAITANGSKYTTATATTELLKTAGSSPVTATVKDKRGRSGSASYTMNVQAYNPPSISKLAVHRCDQDGTENPQGDYAKATFSAAISSLSGKNVAAYTLRYKKADATSYTTVPIGYLDDAFTVNNYSYIFAATGNSAYDVEIEAKDNHGTATRSTSVSTAFTLMNWGPEGTSMAIGKVAEEENTLDVALKLHARGTVQTTGNRYTAASIGTGGSTGYIKMARIEITKDYADVPLTFIFNRRQAVSPMTVHIKFKSIVDLNPGLDTICYEGSNYGAFLVQASASVWDLYIEKGSGWDSITLLDWYVAALRLDRFKVTFPGEQVSTLPSPFYRATPNKMQSILDYVYPVGSIYISYSQVNPGTIFGGTWVRMANTFLWGCDADGDIGVTGGEKTHTLTVNELPSHSHGSVYSGNVSGTKTHSWLASGGSNMAYGTVATGGGAAHNNMPPYTQVAMWRRTA